VARANGFTLAIKNSLISMSGKGGKSGKGTFPYMRGEFFSRSGARDARAYVRAFTLATLAIALKATASAGFA
jgi:hypothetical protein